MAGSLSEAALLFVLSAAVCVMIGRLAIRGLRQAQCLAPTRYEDCPPLLAYQESKQATPTMGGLFVLGVGILMAVVGISAIFGLEKIYLSRTRETSLSSAKP